MITIMQNMPLRQLLLKKKLDSHRIRIKEMRLLLKDTVTSSLTQANVAMKKEPGSNVNFFIRRLPCVDLELAAIDQNVCTHIPG